MKPWKRSLPWLAAVAVIALAVSLGNWQLRRADEKQSLQSQYDAAEAAAPAPLGSASDLAALPSHLPKRVLLNGEFVDSATVYIDNRMVDGVAGFQVVSAMRIAPDAPLVLIDRGWAARDAGDRTRLPLVKSVSGPVRIEGLAVALLPRTLELGGATDASLGIWQNLDYERFEKASGQTVARIVVQQTAGSADGLRRDRPRLDARVDRHRGYAVQW
ncbi:MAG: SURF1 family protein, partial [Burkholderiaceae bacterium]